MKYHYITILFVNLVLIMVCNNSFSQATDDFTSTLPIIIIDTEGKSIPDEPKISVKMQIIYKGEGEINSTNDTLMHYDGWIGIERRGSSKSLEERCRPACVSNRCVVTN